MPCCCKGGSNGSKPRLDPPRPMESNETSLQLLTLNPKSPPTSFPSTSEGQFRGRIDARLYTALELEPQLQTLTYHLGDSPYQDITYNDSLALDERLLPESINLYQNKKENYLEFLQLRGRVDGRIVSPQKEAMWGTNHALSRTREDEIATKMFEPSFIQDLYQKTCSGHVESDENEQGNDDFPSSFDAEFVNETTSTNTQQVELDGEMVSPSKEEIPLETSKSLRLKASTSSKESMEDEQDVDL
ncbi:unnamed protein product [Calypogeia fissa]